MKKQAKKASEENKRRKQAIKTGDKKQAIKTKDIADFWGLSSQRTKMKYYN